jgi:Protein of unknown function (DUF2934)
MAIAVIEEATEERIRQRAYELFHQRGRVPGREQEDWLQAEREILAADEAPSVFRDGFDIDGSESRRGRAREQTRRARG